MGVETPMEKGSAAQFGILFVVFVVSAVAEESTPENDQQQKQAPEELKKGSPIGNTILFVVFIVGLLGYAFLQWCEKMKTHKTGAEARRADAAFQELVANEEKKAASKAEREEEKKKNRGSGVRKPRNKK